MQKFTLVTKMNGKKRVFHNVRVNQGIPQNKPAVRAYDYLRINAGMSLGEAMLLSIIFKNEIDTNKYLWVYGG